MQICYSFRKTDATLSAIKALYKSTGTEYNGDRHFHNVHDSRRFKLITLMFVVKL